MKKITIMVIIIIIVLVLILLKPQILQKFYPKKYAEQVEQCAQEYDIDPLLIYSIIKAESNFDCNAKSSSNALGLMQIMIDTAKENAIKMNMGEISEEDLYNPEINIKIGVRYFKTLLNKYGNYVLASIAYNAGMGNVDKWIEQGILDKEGKNLENIPFNETKNYAKKILQNYKIYKEIY